MQQKSEQTVKSVRENSFGWMIKMLAKSIDNQMLKALEPHDLNLEQFIIIMILLEQDGLIQSDIGKKSNLPSYTVTRNLDVLEKKALITRDKHESSRRSYRIHLTTQCKMLSPKLFSAVTAVNAQITSNLDEKQIVNLRRLLKKLIVMEI